MPTSTGKIPSQPRDLSVWYIKASDINTQQGWDTDTIISVPDNATQPIGLTVDSDGNILLLDDGTDRIYKYTYNNDGNGGSWNEGIATPVGGTWNDIAIDNSGNILLISSNRFIYIYKNNTWSNTPIFSINHNSESIAVDNSGDILVSDNTDHHIYAVNDSNYTSIPFPSGTTNIQGMAVKSNGNIIVVNNDLLEGDTNDRIYEYNVSTNTWNSENIRITSRETNPRGLAIDNNGNILLVGDSKKIYIYNTNHTQYLTINDISEDMRKRNGKDNEIFHNDDSFLYLGLPSRFDFAVFYMSKGLTSQDVEWSYYDGNEWSIFSPSGNYFFDKTGGERFNRLPYWQPKSMTEDMIKDLGGEEKDIVVKFNNNIPDTIPRYWIRINGIDIDEDSDVALLNKVRIRLYASYCNVQEVSDILQIQHNFTDTTYPTHDMIEDLIHNAQSYIDYRTRKSWRLNMVTDEEHDFSSTGFQLYKKYPIEILSLDIWDGGVYERKMEGRDKEFFLVKETGMIYFSRFFLLPVRLRAYAGSYYGWGTGEFNMAVRVDYLYGNNIYDSDREGGLVNDITRKIVALDLIHNYDFSVLTPSGADNISLERKSDLWRAEIEEKLDSLMSIEII